MLLWILTIKLFSWLPPDCNFAIVGNHNVNIFGGRDLPKGSQCTDREPLMKRDARRSNAAEPKEEGIQANQDRHALTQLNNNNKKLVWRRRLRYLAHLHRWKPFSLLPFYNQSRVLTSQVTEGQISHRKPSQNSPMLGSPQVNDTIPLSHGS